MNDLHDMIRKFTIQEDRKIKKICLPIEQSLGVSYFSYFTIQADGQFSFLSNYPEQVDFYFSERLYTTCPYFIHPNLLRSGCVLDQTTPNLDYLDLIEKRYGMRNILLMIDKQVDAIEGFIFFNKMDKNNDLNVYLSKLDLLKKFGRYFVKEADPLIKKIKSEKYNIKHATGVVFEKSSPQLLLRHHDEQTKNFLKLISPLSDREHSCVILYRQGHSAQATAAILGLSRRTVENYFENIKNKLGCASKRDLLSY